MLDLNRTAMSMLRDQNFSKALHSLKQASMLLENVEQPAKRLKLQGITLSNFGCFYKRTKKPNVALKYLTKACEQEEMAAVDNVSLAGTHLNMCAIYSDLNKHELALEQGLKALDLMKNSGGNSPNLISTLVIAYHNTGVEYEFLGIFQEALQCYRLAWETAERYLGSKSALCVAMKGDYLNLDGKRQEKEIRNSAREELKKEPVPRIIGSRIRFRSAGKRCDSKTSENRGRSAARTVKTASSRNTMKNWNVRAPKKPKNLLELTTDLEKVRFLTGDRLQPMFKSEFRVNSLPRGSVKQKIEGPAIGDIPRRNVSATIRKIKNNDRISEELQDIEIHASQFKNNIKEIKPKLNHAGIERMLIKHHRENAAIKIQKHFKGYKARQLRKSLQLASNHKKTSEKQNLPLLKGLETLKPKAEIQKVIRSKTPDLINAYPLEVIPEIPDTVSPAPEEAKIDPLIISQAVIRGFLIRNEFSKLTSAAITIQKAVRCHQCYVIYKSIQEAVICIQAYYRGFVIRRSAQLHNN